MTADAVGPVLEILPVARGGFGVLVDRHDDCLDMKVAPPFPDRDVAGLCQRIEEGRIILGVVVVPFRRLTKSCRECWIAR